MFGLRDHPNFLVRFVGRIVSAVVGLVSIVVIVAVVFWALDTFAHTHIWSAIGNAWAWLHSGDLKTKLASAVGGVLGVGLVAYLVIDGLLGDNYYGGGYGRGRRVRIRDANRDVNVTLRDRNGDGRIDGRDGY